MRKLLCRINFYFLILFPTFPKFKTLEKLDQVIRAGFTEEMYLMYFSGKNLHSPVRKTNFQNRWHG